MLSAAAMMVLVRQSSPQDDSTCKEWGEAFSQGENAQTAPQEKEKERQFGQEACKCGGSQCSAARAVQPENSKAMTSTLDDDGTRSATNVTTESKMKIEWMSPEAKQEWEAQYRLQQSLQPAHRPEDAFDLDLSVGSGKSPLLQNIADRQHDLQATMRRRGLLKLSSPER